MIKQTSITEDQIAKLLYKKDQQAFLLAYDRYSAALYGVINKMVKDRTLASDILMKSFEAMWHQSYSLKHHTGSLFIWMHNITRGVVMEEMNKIIREEREERQLRQPRSFFA